MFGYGGAVLRVNLSRGTIRREDLPGHLVKAFIGGRGFGIKYLYDEVDPKVDPLDPGNKLLLLNGPLAGTNAQSVSRWMAVTKSPLTGTFTRSVGGADFGAWMKFAGVDLIIIEGKSPSPVYLHMTTEEARLLDASGLWGLDTARTQEAIREEHGPKTRTACIGPAGENLVRYAVIASGRRTASRGGVGTVMGSKNLKAVAITADRRIELADPAAFSACTREMIERARSDGEFKVFKRYGTATAEVINGLGIYPVRNFREGLLEDFPAISRDAYDEITTGHSGCYSCLIKCGKNRELKEGPYAKTANEGPEYESIWAFTGPMASADRDATLVADKLCDDYGIDTLSTGGTIGFAYELYEKGIIDSRDTGGLKLEYGCIEPALQLIPMIALRQGFGDLLAEGSLRAAQRIGKSAEEYAIQVKGLELPAYEPRGAKAHGLNYATSNIGASHCYGYALQEIDGVPLPSPVDRFAEKGKGKICKFNQDFTALFEFGIACTFPPQFGWLTPEIFCGWLRTATGIEEFGDTGYVWKAAERVYNLERLFNLAAGLTRRDDTLPRRFLTEALRKGSSEGEVFSGFDVMLEEYYEARGWDRDGRPTREKLKELDL